ncbi:hypothetical protein PTRG_00398 [Pyrenophora tritici-repentis Pt-1C-BFP]|uniref:Uncharacterized protein n=1 Tax=Pyrenophora tritici-repentis (strain Pt-1C-BFP) TaxID=426418 RepID=B2VR49_PYRTR|nr:uncharacterized protein PTRG_00398 [Pyrenophora tritici-repentis Pt-1C-BFP]EDU39836.1 hypothetical protein PTRG_00398 [Pyrenophora tritici-repentis Pt-1C-BFP]
MVRKSPGQMSHALKTGEANITDFIVAHGTTFVNNDVFTQSTHASTHPHKHRLLPNHPVFKIINKPTIPTTLPRLSNFNLPLRLLTHRSLFLRRNHSAYPRSLTESLAWRHTT